MFNLVERRRIYYTFSGILLLIGIITLIYSTVDTGNPLQLSIDFTGGTLFDLQFSESVGEQEIRDTFRANGYDQLIVQELTPLENSLIGKADYEDGSRWSVRTEDVGSDEAEQNALDALAAEVAPLDETSRTKVSAAVGNEVTQAGIVATAAATFVILFFVWYAFYGIPHSFRYGPCAIIAMFHDILVTVTAMSIFGLLFDWQADALFLTALLTVLGFSVQDSIVVFDRIRENLNNPRRKHEKFELIVNRSVLETIHRSLATQLNAFFVMAAIVLFGGETVRQFIVIMMIGLLSGTYSSIFIAVPLLVSWEKGEIPFINQEGKELRNAPSTQTM